MHEYESGLSRREVFQRGGLIAGAMILGSAAPAIAEPEVGGARDRADVTLTEGTNLSVSLSPDGKRLAFDLVTGIWVLPVAGGRARRLTDDLQDATQPQWSPDSKQLVFQAYRDGNFHLWLIDADGGAPRQLTSGPFDHREPKFSPDGKRLIFSSDRGSTGAAWLTSDLNLDLSRFGMPRQAFGAAMVSSVGMFGVTRAYTPLAAYYKVPLIAVVGSVADRPAIVDGAVVPRPMLTVTATFDHRYADGAQASRMAAAVLAYCADPAAYEPRM